MSAPTPSKTTPATFRAIPEDGIPPPRKVAYGVGAVVLQTGNNTIQNMGNIIFNIELGVGLPLIGFGMMLFRVFDALLDPFVGNLSDNTRTRWGRRRPYIFTGAILSAISFPLIWLVPESWGETATFAYFLATSILFFLCFTIYVVPYETLSAELSPDYHERTSVVAYRSFFSKVAIILGGWIFAITQLPIFENTMEGMRWTALGIGILILGTGLMPAFFCRERFHKTAEHQRKVTFVESLKLSISNKPFLLIIGILLFVTTGNNLVGSLGQYINIYYIFGGDKESASIMQGYFWTIFMGTSLLTIPAAIWISKRHGKRSLILLTLCLTLVGTLSKWWLFTPAHPEWQLIVAFILGLGGTGFWVGLVSLIGDAADYDEYHNNARREGSLTSIYTWVFKFSLAITIFLGNLLLQSTGFDAALGGNQTPQTFLLMRILFVGFTSVAIIISIVLILHYPISETKAYAIRHELELRRGKA